MFEQTIFKDGIKLGLFAIATVGLVVITFAMTEDRIEEQKRRSLESALFEIVPESSHNNDMLTDTVQVKHDWLGNEQAKAAYIAKQDGEPVAAVLQVAATEGYGGTINLLVGINADGTLAGARVVPPHPETPGLGDKIETKKSDWMLEFSGKSLQNPQEPLWKVKKDGGEFDSFTGATITPRAVVKAIYQSLKYFEMHKQDLFGEVANTASATSKLTAEGA